MEMLRRLGSGERIDSVCQAAGITRAAFDAWWQGEARARVPDMTGSRRTGVRHSVQIERDTWGIPHIYAENDADLFFGLGYAMAQDRLFQLDFLRRRGAGRLSEILGAEENSCDAARPARLAFAISSMLDLLARTVGFQRIAIAEWEMLPAPPRKLSFQPSRPATNALMIEMQDRLPIEFDLLEYRRSRGPHRLPDD